MQQVSRGDGFLRFAIARRSVWTLSTLALGLLTLRAAPVAADEWPQFRGPNCSGISSSPKPLPTEFSYQDKVLWSAPLGDGVSSPVIAAGKLYVTAMVGAEKVGVFCFDATTGEQLWSREMDTGPLPAIHQTNSYASSTPATDGRRVYVYFSTLGLMAFDARGSRLWHHELPVPQYLMDWGPAASPIVYGDLVIFNQDDDLNSYLLALDKQTGEVRWRTPRPEMLGGYATPVLCTAGGRTDLVVAGTGKMKGYDPKTGRELWTCNTLLRTIMTTPVVRDGVIYISVESYGDTDRVLKYALLQWKDTNQDGKLSKAEVPEAFSGKFEAGDTNRDGFLVEDEIDKAFQAPTNMVGGGNIIQAIRGGGRDNVTATHLLWNLDNKAPSNLSSPLVVGDRLFVVKRGGISSCFDVRSGETVWYQKRIRNFGEYFASPVAGDGKIYVTGDNGFVVVVLADAPDLHILARNDMGDRCIATPAIADGRLYFRTRRHLYCVSDEAE